MKEKQTINVFPIMFSHGVKLSVHKVAIGTTFQDTELKTVVLSLCVICPTCSAIFEDCFG